MAAYVKDLSGGSLLLVGTTTFVVLILGAIAKTSYASFSNPLRKINGPKASFVFGVGGEDARRLLQNYGGLARLGGLFGVRLYLDTHSLNDSRLTLIRS